jgi:hypothetical protein
MDEVEVCLCIMFNHKYETNVPILREIYGSRFSKIVFLMPFYRGTEPDILPYYANSFYFQLCVTQNIRALQAINAKHYVFIADDLILNPEINERNVIVSLRAGVDTVSIPWVANLTGEAGSAWTRRLDIAKIHTNAVGVEWKTLLPPYAKMVERIQKVGVPHRVDITHFCDELIRLGHKLPENRPLIIDPPYPCLAAYSDIFVVPGIFLEDFAHYSGVTGAMKLFAEVAIPTVSLMVSETLSFIPYMNFNPNASNVDFARNGVVYWGKEVDNFSAACESKLANAFTGLRSEVLFIHPLKLSKWT